MIETRTRMTANEAYQRVVAHQGKSDEKDYKSLANSLPGMIMQNGLAQATGFLVAKGKDEHAKGKGEDNEHKALLDDLTAVLRAAKVVGAADGKELHCEIIGSDDPRRWMQLTRHSLEASAWIKRYAQGLLKGEDDAHASDQSEEEHG